MTITFLPDPTDIQRFRDGRAQRVKRRVGKWSDEIERGFLAALASSCNVRWSARQVGIDPTYCYHRRNRDAVFAQRWAEALAQGYADLELELLRAAIAAMECEPLEHDAPVRPVTPGEAIQLLAMHKRGAGRNGKRMGRAPRRLTMEDVAPALRRKVAAIKRASERGIRLFKD